MVPWPVGNNCIWFIGRAQIGQYVFGFMAVAAQGNMFLASWLWTIEGLRRDTEYEANDQDWVQIKHNAQASTYAGIRINIFTKANSTKSSSGHDNDKKNKDNPKDTS